MVDGDKLIPFVRQFYSSPSTYLWEDEVGETRRIQQGEGGEQGDPLMPLLFSVGQHRALVEVQASLRAGERIFAFLDDIYVVCSPERVGDVYKLVEHALRTKTGISIHLGKTKLWNAEGRKPGVADALTRAAQKEKPEAMVWRGDQSLPTVKQGLTVLGVPVGHPDYIASELAQKTDEQSLLFERIPHVGDVQAAWLLLSFCAATRANFWLRTVPREFTLDYAEKHDRSVHRCLEQILQMDDIPQHIWESASMPLTLGGLGVGGASRMCDAAHWSSWADCLEMVQNRHPHIAHAILGGLATRTPGYLRAVQESGDRLRGVGVQVPSWEALAAGLRPEDVDMEPEPSQPKHGWQKFASVTIQNVHRETVVWPTLSPAEQAMVRSQSGPLASVPFTAMPTSRVTRITSDLFRVLLLRRLRSPLPLCVRSCRCGRLLDVLGHHRAACSTGGALGRRGFAVESAVAQICREGGARVSLNAMLRDLDIVPLRTDGRRLEVVAEGLTLFGGCQLALDATVVSPLHGDATHRRRADIEDGVALREARRRKERTYPELCQGNGRARLVVIAGEVGGRWSDETKTFLWSLACAKATSVPRRMYGSARAAWYRRWTCLLACSSAKAVACCLLGKEGSPGAGDQVPSVNDVVADARFLV